VRRTLLLGNSQRNKMRRKEKHVIRKESSSIVIRKNKKSMPQRNEKNNPVIKKSFQLIPQSRIIRSNPAIKKYQVFQLYHQENPFNFSHQEG